MPDKINVVVNGQDMEIKLAPKMTVLCHKDNVKLDIPTAFEISPEKTIACADSLPQDIWDRLRKNPEFVKQFDMFFGGDIKLENEPDLKLAGHGVRHVVGMILLLGQAMAEGRTPFFRFPETYLHPSTQANIVNWMNYRLNERPPKPGVRSIVKGEE